MIKILIIYYYYNNNNNNSSSYSSSSSSSSISSINPCIQVAGNYVTTRLDGVRTQKTTIWIMFISNSKAVLAVPSYTLGLMCLTP
jgi:hypothetical protein